MCIQCFPKWFLAIEAQVFEALESKLSTAAFAKFVLQELSATKRMMVRKRLRLIMQATSLENQGTLALDTLQKLI